MATQRLAVIGAGPKGAALAAKAWCLRQEGYDVQVELFERHQCGAHWAGKQGYTDGEQRLCTPAERDLGFPYSHDLGPGVAERMQERFSWQAFLVGLDGGGRYAEWVNHGRKPPLHSDFARYLEFALERAETDPVIGTVQKVEIQEDRWSVVTGRGGRAQTYPGFDGLVVTGPGPAKSKVTKAKDARLFDGVDFWSRKSDRDSALASLGAQGIVIIGGGGTAAAVTAWVLRNNHKAPISLINSQAMLFTRTANFFESSLFSDELTWQAIKPDDRFAFTARLNRGVVWETITDLLSDADNLTLLPGRASRIDLGPFAAGSADEPLVVTYDNHGAKGLTKAAGLVVDATGFDEWDFLRLFPATVKDQMANADLKTAAMTGMDRDLSMPLVGSPKLHVPNLSDMIGPGFQSLMVLGAMADRVLKPYRNASA